MNNFRVEIYNNQTKAYEDYTAFAVFPLKVAHLLDEQLDEANLTLKGITSKYFQPQTRVRITITNFPECVITESKFQELNANNENPEQVTLNLVGNRLRATTTINMIIANDRAVEVPVGSGRYNHEIYLIELTKLMERFIGDSLTFTNALGNKFLDGAVFSQPTDTTVGQGYNEISEFPAGTFDYYTTPVEYNGELKILSLNEITEKLRAYLVDYMEEDGVYVSTNIIKDGNYPASITINSGVTTVYNPETIDTSYTIQAKQTMSIEYEFMVVSVYPSSGNIFYRFFKFKYVINAVSNRLPLKKWTITDVINRVFDLIEPLAITDYGSYIETKFPRFRLQGVQYDANGKRLSTYVSGSQAELLDKIIAPEFSFTRETLRETLQQIGGFIHGEPRITGEYTDNNEEKYFEVAYDFYGSNEYSKISDQAYITATFGTDINQYCTALDSSADNLTNTLDWAQGVIVEPFNGYYKSLRTEQTTARLAEDNSTYIATQFPIEKLGGANKVICKFIPGIGEGNWDITPYVFEEHDYMTLSSYQGSYPFSKAYALYYTQGQKNIKGLFFKAEHAINPIFHNYAIVNILRAVTGNNGLEIEGQNLMLLAFSIVYLPIYSARVKTHKQIIEPGLPSTLAYNQGANAIETRYYGEHLKGVVERLGNVEKTYTYHLGFLSQIPKVGTRYDKDYFISNVSYEILPAYIKCTVALSKHFNRKSQYIGINSQKRMWEVSERQAQIRQSLFPTYIVASETYSQSDAFAGKISLPAQLLFNYGEGAYDKPISAVQLIPLDINGNPVVTYDITLPVVASAFGNSMTFSYGFEDNFSAGQKVVNVTGGGGADDNVTGYWGDNVPYTDYYGRFYSILNYLLGNNIVKEDNLTSTSLPQGGLTIDALNKTYLLLTRNYLYRKDNREIPQITHEIAVVSDNENIIIGSALCRNCSAVNTNPKAYSAYLLTEPLNVIDGKVDLTTAVSDLDLNITIDANSITVKPTGAIPFPFPASKAWAIVTEPSETVINVTAEDGTETTQTIQEGGELLIGQNIDSFSATDGATIYFSVKNKIYD